MTLELSQSSDQGGKPAPQQAASPLRDQVRLALQNYFQQLNGHGTSDLYQMVLAEVEQPMLETVLEHTRGNQTRAAGILGISRSTLRKKLAQYNLG